MSISIPYIIYEKLEEKLGKESAHAIAESLENVINESFSQSQEKLKYQITDELKKDLANKNDLLLVKQDLESKIDIIKKEIENMRKENDYKIELLRKEMRMIFVILTFLIIILNQNNIELIAKLFGIIK